MQQKKQYRPLPEYLTIGPSDIHGAGIFALEDIPAGIDMGITHVYDLEFQHNYLRTPLGGFINHCETPNCELVEDESDQHYKKIKTLHKIEQGKEITLKYSLYNFDE